MCLSLGHISIKYYRDAKESFEAIKDRTLLGSHKHFTILSLVAEAEATAGNNIEALKLYDQVFVKQRESIFRETLLSLTVTEKFQYNKRLGELYEANSRTLEAANAYEAAY